MPELPEVAHLAAQIKATLPGKRFVTAQVAQPKCLNIAPEALALAVQGAHWLDCYARGKWLVNQLDHGWLLFNLGMGGEVLYHDDPSQAPEKQRVLFTFADGSALSLSFWWFGHVHWVRDLAEHEMLARVGRNALDLTRAEFLGLCHNRRGGIKNFLLKQQPVAGIGNMYIHDILFLARLHPLRAVNSLSEEEKGVLYDAIQQVLASALAKGGSSWERDLFDQPGGYTKEDIIIGYREGEPCPVCGTSIAKVRTGSNSGFVCPVCQPSDSVSEV